MLCPILLLVITGTPASSGPTSFRTVIIKTGQVTKEELVKQIGHVNKIRGDTFRRFKCFKGLLPPATTPLIVPHSVILFIYFYFFESQLLKDLLSLASLSGCSPRKKHCSLTCCRC